MRQYLRRAQEDEVLLPGAASYGGRSGGGGAAEDAAQQRWGVPRHGSPPWRLLGWGRRDFRGWTCVALLVGGGTWARATAPDGPDALLGLAWAAERKQPTTHHRGSRTKLPATSAPDISRQFGEVEPSRGKRSAATCVVRPLRRT